VLASPNRHALFYPETAPYDGLTLAERVEALLETIEHERTRLRPDLACITWLEGMLAYERGALVVQDPYWDLTHNFLITPADSDSTISRSHAPVRLSPKPQQDEILRYIETCRQANIPAWIVVPKVRQSKVTTLALLSVLQHVSRNGGKNGLLMAHDEPTMLDIFGRLKFAFENDPLRPSEKISNRRELIFDKLNSQIKTRVANTPSEGVAHGTRWAAVLGSEAGFYDPEGSYDLVQGILIAVHQAPTWSVVIFEGRGGMPAGWFYDVNMQEMKSPGSTGFKQFFLPVFRRDDATLPFESALAKAKFLESLTEPERILMGHYGADLEQVHWYRETYRTKYAGGDERRRRRNFEQDNPLTLLQAFQSYEAEVFDSIQVDIVRSKARAKPPTHWTIRPGTSQGCEVVAAGARLVYATPAPQLARGSKGELAVWETPQPGHRYCFGVDIAWGDLKGDNSSVFGICRDCRTVAFRLTTKDRWWVFLDTVRAVSKHWNDARINPESNFRPEFVDQLAHTDRRAYLYMRRSPTRVDVNESVLPRWGWNAQGGTKRQLIHALQERLVTEPALLADEMLLGEMGTFGATINKTGTAVNYTGARGTNHDDVVIAAGLALWCDLDDILPAQDEVEAPETLAEQVRRQVEEMSLDAQYAVNDHWDTE
jgi:hypothetical protein